MNAGYALHPEAGSIEAAHRLVQDLEATVSRAARFPEMGHLRSDLTGRALRFLSVREYLIAYAPDTRPLWLPSFMAGETRA